MSRRRSQVMALAWGLSGVIWLVLAIVSSATVVHVLGGVAAAGSLGLSGYYWRQVNPAA